MTIINKIQNLNWNKRNVNQITQIVVHHSAYRHDNQDNQSRFETLKGFHTQSPNFWFGLSYHYVIFKNGEIWQCNNLTDASPTDGINYPSLGILVDGFFHDSKDKPAIEQLKSLDWLLGDLCNNHPEFPAVRADVKAHREVNSTACCGDDLFGYVKEWRDTGKFAILDSQTIVEAPKTSLEVTAKFHLQSEEELNRWITQYALVRIKELGGRDYLQELSDLELKLKEQLKKNDEEKSLLNQEKLELQNKLDIMSATKEKFKFDWNKQYDFLVKSGAWKVLVGLLIATINPLSIKYLGYPVTEQQLLDGLSLFFAGYGGVDTIPFFAGKIKEKLSN